MADSGGTMDVRADEVQAVVRLLRGDETQLVSYTVEEASTTLPGFCSQILRVRVTVNQQQGDSSELSYIIKRAPHVEYLRDVVSESDVFEREVHFFSRALPLLHERCSELPVVRCLSASRGLILLEDLSAQGFHVLASSMSEVGQNSLGVRNIRLALERLAQLHAASLDHDWSTILPLTQVDYMLETASCPFQRLFRKSRAAYADTLQLFYPQTDKKYSEWLRSDRAFDTLLKLVKPDPSDMNVLGHGDFWVNNIMFKLSEGREAVDVRFIDFQMNRVVPPSRDIQNLLYTCESREFRETHEPELLRAYVASFNHSLGTERLGLDSFLREYEASRLYGVLVAMVFRTMNLMPELYPEHGKEMTSDMMENMLSGDQFASLPSRCKQNPQFERTVRDLLEELLVLLKRRTL